MPIELDPLEEFDVLSEFQFPDFIYSLDSIEEKISFSNYINSLSNRRILLIHDELFNSYFVLASLKEDQLETLVKEGGSNIKKIIISNLSDSETIKKVAEFASELDKRSKTTENSTRSRNILQYIKDNKSII